MGEPEGPGHARRVLAMLPHAVMLVSADGRVAYANERAESFLGSGRETLARRRFDDLVDRTSPIAALVESVRRAHSPITQHNVPWSAPDGRGVRPVDVDAVPDGTGGVIVMILERSLAERIDRQLTHRGAARSVSGLAAMLAHEIKNPLSGIRGAAQLLETTVEPSERELAALIRTETDRIVRLVNTMEVFTDERPLERSSVNAHAVLDRVLKVARAGFASGVRVREEYDPSLPDLDANHDQMVQVFLNLVKNAVEATKAVSDPKIALRTTFRPGIRMARPDGGGRTSLPLEISVSDNGPGVPAELRENLFDPFVTARANGTGLGLALVAKVVRDHGGIVDFDTGPEGSTFRVLMPAWAEPRGEGA